MKRFKTTHFKEEKGKISSYDLNLHCVVRFDKGKEIKE